MARKAAAKKKPAAGPARISDDAVRKATGKGWQEWFALLDEAGAVTMKHAEIARLLPGEIGGWWQQMVTVAYEQARELRAVHQKYSGDFAAAISKTFNCPLEILYAAWDDARTRAAWLKKGVTVKKSTKNKSMRIKVGKGKDARAVDVNFYATDSGKAKVALDHRELGSEAEVQEARATWKAALERLGNKIATMG